MTTNRHIHSEWIEVKASRRRRITRRLGRRIRDVGKPIIDRDNDGRCLEASDGSFIPCPPGVRDGSTLRNGKPSKPRSLAQRLLRTPVSKKAIREKRKALPQNGETVEEAKKRFLDGSVIDEIPGTRVPKKQTPVIEELAFLYDPDDIDAVRSSVYPDYDSWREWYEQGRAETEQFLDLFTDEGTKERILKEGFQNPFAFQLQTRSTDGKIEILDADGNVATTVTGMSSSYAGFPHFMAAMMIESGLTLPDYIRDAQGLERSARYGGKLSFSRSDFEFEDTPAGRYYQKIVDRLFDFREGYAEWSKKVADQWPSENSDKWDRDKGFASADADTATTVSRAIENFLNPNFLNSPESENQVSESLHEMGHIVLGQGAGRHGDHSANLSMMAALGEDLGRTVFNLVTAIQWGQFHGKDDVDPELWKEIKPVLFPIWGDMDPRLVGWWK